MISQQQSVSRCSSCRSSAPRWRPAATQLEFQNVKGLSVDHWWVYLKSLMWKDLKLITDGFFCYIVCVTFCNDSKKQPEEMNKLLHNSAPMQLLKDVSMFAFKPQCSLWPKVCRQSHELLFRSYNILKLRFIMLIKMTRCPSRTSCHLDQLTWLDHRSHTRHQQLNLGGPHCCNFPQSSEMI